MACSPGTPGAALDELLTLNLARLGANERDAAAHASLAAVLERIAGRSAAPSAAEDGPAAIAPSGAGGAVEVDLNYITMAAQRWFRSGNLRYNAGVATYGEALGAFDRCLELDWAHGDAGATSARGGSSSSSSAVAAANAPTAYGVSGVCPCSALYMSSWLHAYFGNYTAARPRMLAACDCEETSKQALANAAVISGIADMEASQGRDVALAAGEKIFQHTGGS